MEETTGAQQRSHPSSAITTAIIPTSTTTTTTTTSTTRITKHGDKTGEHQVVKYCQEMGGNRSGSTSSSVGWMGEVGDDNSSNSTVAKTPTTPRQPSKRDSGYHTDFSPATLSSHRHFTFDNIDPNFPDVHWGSTGSHHQDSSLESPVGSSAPHLPRSSLVVNPGWQPRRVLPDVDSDDEGDDDAFVSDNVMIGATSHLPGLRVTAPSGTRPETRTLPWRRHSSSDDATDSGRLAALPQRVETEEERRNALRGRHLNYSPRTVAFGRREVVDDDSCSEGEEEEGVSCTDYHHAPLSMMTLPGGERIRPLLARTTATQTSHLHCQLIDQILDCPQDFPQSARGSAVRRLRYYSEGEETVGVSSLTGGPLPDIVPVSQGHRERSLSAPDLESLQRQRVAAREVGRELRRISDEFVRNHEAFREQHQHGAMAALHAELNGVAAFFLTGMRRFLYRGFAGYFRHVFHMTRQARPSPDTPHLPRTRRDSCVDQQR